VEGRDTFRLRIARPPRRVNRRRRPPGMYGPCARAGVFPRGRGYPLLEYGLIRKASRDVRIFRREGSKMVMTGALGLAGPAGATAELFAMGWGLMRGRVGRGESSSYGKSSSSLKDPGGRGDPDIHYYTCLRRVLRFGRRFSFSFRWRRRVPPLSLLQFLLISFTAFTSVSFAN